MYGVVSLVNPQPPGKSRLVVFKCFKVPAAGPHLFGTRTYSQLQLPINSGSDSRPSDTWVHTDMEILKFTKIPGFL